MIDFPMIRNISDVLPYIEGRDEFIVADKEGYRVINYNVMFEDTFLHPEEEGISADEKITRQMRRECRGIIFDAVTGDIIRRPYHKFKNVNEAPETQADRIDLSRPHAILEKLDGSMIAPFIVDGQLIWGTKMGATDVAKPVEEFIYAHRNYHYYAWKMIMRGYTPIFEWCSRKQRIVLDYKEDQLILTAVRNMTTGEYVPLEWTPVHEWNIPLVREFEPQTDMKAFLEYVRDLEDLEGFVVRFDDGHMLKLKCHWYLQIHKAKEAILQDRNIVELILEDSLDDVKAHLPAEDRDRLTQFENAFNLRLADKLADLANELNWIHEDGIDRKTFAIKHAPNFEPFTRAILFKNFDKIDHNKLWDDIRNTVRNNLTKTVKYEAIREAWFDGVVFNV